jgi:hypothetical protein
VRSIGEFYKEVYRSIDLNLNIEQLI